MRIDIDFTNFSVPFASEGTKYRDIMSVESAVMYDSLLVVADAVKKLDYYDSVLLTDRVNASCSREMPWSEGATLFNYLNSAEVKGLTGNISFKVRPKKLVQSLLTTIVQ